MSDKNISQWLSSHLLTLPFHRSDQNEKGNLSYRCLCTIHSLLLCVSTNRFLITCALICEHLCMMLPGLFCCFRESTWHTLGNSKTYWNVALDAVMTCESVINICVGWHSWWRCDAMIGSLKTQLNPLFGYTHNICMAFRLQSANNFSSKQFFNVRKWAIKNNIFSTTCWEKFYNKWAVQNTEYFQKFLSINIKLKSEIHNSSHQVTQN